MPFGGDTVTFVSFVDGPTPGPLGTYPQVEVTFDAPGCRHRPLTFAETAELAFDVATEWWRTTLPIGEYGQTLLDKLKLVEPDAVIRVDNVDYAVVGGVRMFKDFSGPFKATIHSKRHIG